MWQTYICSTLIGIVSKIVILFGRCWYIKYNGGGISNKNLSPPRNFNTKIYSEVTAVPARTPNKKDPQKYFFIQFTYDITRKRYYRNTQMSGCRR